MQLHGHAWRRMPEIRIVAVADVDRGRAERLASQFPGAALASDASAIFADPQVDAVAILTPPATHGAFLMAALDAGKHVFVEKPLTSIPAEADRLVERVRGSDRVVAVGHNLRCHRFVRQARALLRGGVLGDLLAMRGVWTSPSRPREAWRDEPGLAGSVWMDVGVHHIDLFQHLAGSAVESIAGFETRGADNWQTAALSGKLQGGIVFTSVVSQRGIYEHNLHLAGTKASVEFSCQRANSFRLISNVHLGLRAQMAEAQQYLRQFPDVLAAVRTGGDWLASYEQEWHAFLGSVRQGSPVVCTVGEAAAAIKVCSQLAGKASIITV